MPVVMRELDCYLSLDQEHMVWNNGVPLVDGHGVTYYNLQPVSLNREIVIRCSYVPGSGHCITLGHG